VLALRLLWAVAVVAVAVWFLAQGLPLGAAAVIVAGVVLRRYAESGRLARLAGR
jgi:NhaP-type Na+/H+ or K+/H+ antiporter